MAETRYNYVAKEREVQDAYYYIDELLDYIDSGEMLYSEEEDIYWNLEKAYWIMENGLAEIAREITKQGFELDDFWIFNKWLYEDYCHPSGNYICPADRSGDIPYMLKMYREEKMRKMFGAEEKHSAGEAVVA